MRDLFQEMSTEAVSFDTAGKAASMLSYVKHTWIMSENSSSTERQLDKPLGMDDLVAGEVWNGRLAMIGFISAIATEVLIGQSLLPKLFWFGLKTQARA